MAEKGEKDEFPIVMIGLSVVGVAWYFGHPWLGVMLVGIVGLPLLLGGLSAALIVVPLLVVFVTVSLFTIAREAYRGVRKAVTP